MTNFLIFLQIYFCLICHFYAGNVSSDTQNIYQSKKSQTILLQNLKIESNKQNLEFSIEPLKHNVLSREISVYTVETNKQQFFHQYYQKIDREKFDFFKMYYYQDVQKLAVLALDGQNGSYNYSGVHGVGEPKAVEAVRIKNNKTYTKFIHDQQIVGLVFNRTVRNYFEEIYRHQPESEKLHEPLKAMYPKFLVAVDNNLFRKLGNNIKKTLEYVSIFWNSVNLRFSKLTYPQIKIIVTGIVIAKDEKGFKHVYEARNLINKEGFTHTKLMSDWINSFNEEFLFQTNFSNYDATLLMTNLNFGIVKGSAFLGSICSQNLNFGFVYDDANYVGIEVATHEIGHMLGVSHDESFFNGTICNSRPDEVTATFMSEFASTALKYVWSQCSLSQFKNFAFLKKAECLRWPYKVNFSAKREKNYKDEDFSNLKPDKKTSFPNKKVHFDLKRLEHNVLSNEVTIYTAETNKHEYFHQYYRRVDSKKIDLPRVFFQDLQKLSVLTRYNQSGTFKYDGVFGIGHPNVLKAFSGKDIIISRSETDQEKIIDLIYDETVIKNFERKNSRRPKEELLSEPLKEMYPKLLVIVDYNIFKQFGKSVPETIKYVSLFWNAVNLRYSKMNSPKVKIIVSGVIIAKDETALKYTTENSTNYIDFKSWLRDIKENFQFRVNFRNFDSVFAMLNVTLFGKWNLGQSIEGAVCENNLNFAFVTDDANYSGLERATRELGHLLGMYYDEQIPFDENEMKCMPDLGSDVKYFMSGVNNLKKRYVWSQCSQSQLQNVALSKRLECLRNLYKADTIIKTSNIRKINTLRFITELEINGNMLKLNFTPYKQDVISFDVPIWIAKSNEEKPLDFTFHKTYSMFSKVKTSLIYNFEKMVILLPGDDGKFDGTVGLDKPVACHSVKGSYRVENAFYEEQDTIFDFNKNYTIIQTFLEKYNNKLDAEMLSIPLKVLYLKILIVIDSELYKSLGSDVEEVTKFISIFWNSVNLRFEKFKLPKIQIRITGIIIVQDDLAIKYLQLRQFNSSEVIKNWNENLKNKFEEKILNRDYNIILTMLNNHQAKSKYKRSFWPKTACNVSSNIGYFETNTNFLGIKVATRKLARLVNIRKDEYYAMQANCKSEKFENLGTKSEQTETYFWSKCSQSDLLHFSFLKAAECLKN